MLDLSPLHSPRGTRLQHQRLAPGGSAALSPQQASTRMSPKTPEQLIVYGGRGKAARDLGSLHAIVRTLERLRKR